jgi:hypothetical protein
MSWLRREVIGRGQICVISNPTQSNQSGFVSIHSMTLIGRTMRLFTMVKHYLMVVSKILNTH